MIDKKEFGQELTRLRRACALSQLRLAAMTGVSAQAVSKWETGVSLPDIELILPLAQALGVDAAHILSAGQMQQDASSLRQPVPRELFAGFDLDDAHAALLGAMSTRLTREQLYACAQLLQVGKLEYRLALEARYEADSKPNVLTKALDANAMPDACLALLGTHLCDLTLRAVYMHDNPIQNLIGSMRCPQCGGALAYRCDGVGESVACEEHAYRIVDGVVDFGTLEEHGNTWSSWIRSYEDYKTWLLKAKDWDDAELNGFNPLTKRMFEQMRLQKPAVVLDIGSGLALSVQRMVRDIDWPCQIILTDISHRILKYDKRRFEEDTQNPNVTIHYWACDDTRLPLADASVDMILSIGGFENIRGDILCPMREARRVLRPGGILNSMLFHLDDRHAASTLRWLQLIRQSPDPDMEGFQRKLFDMPQWQDHFSDLGLIMQDCWSFRGQDAPPEGNEFPYDYEIARWMAISHLVAQKPMGEA